MSKRSNEISTRKFFPNDPESEEKRHNRLYAPLICVLTGVALLGTVLHINATETTDHRKPLIGSATLTPDAPGDICVAAIGIAEDSNQQVEEDQLTATCLEESYKIAGLPKDTLVLVEVDHDSNVSAIPLYSGELTDQDG